MKSRLFRADVGWTGRVLVPVVFALSVFAFVSDLWRANTLAYGLFYTPLVSTAVFLRPRWSPWLLSAIGAAFVTIGAIFPVIDPDIPDLMDNRLLSLMAIFATAFFVHQARSIQERLAAQTRRAAAAERIKSEVLANLSDEIRAPLQRLLAVSRLMLLDGSPDQREALIRVRTGVRHLLTSSENLVELTTLDDRVLRPDTIDVRAVSREAMEQAEIMASERQVALHGPSDGAPLPVRGDPWAFRRIIDTLLLNAIANSPAGGIISLRLEALDGMVTLSVSDPGDRLARHLAEDATSPSVRTGMALSVRLADRIGGRLIAVDQPDGEPMMQLRLPAAAAQEA